MKAGNGNQPFNSQYCLEALDESLMLLVVSADGSIAFVNDTFCEISGYRRAELIGKDFRQFDSGSNPREISRELRKALRRREKWRGEICNRVADKSLRWFEATIIPVLDAGNSPERYIAVAVDITEHKQTLEVLRSYNEKRQADEEKLRLQEEALSETLEQLQTVIQNTNALIYMLDSDNRFVLINRRFEELFDLNLRDVRGKLVSDVFPPEYADSFIVNNRKVLEAGRAIEFEERAPQPDGEHTFISLKVPQLGADGKPKGVIGISTDITERKRAEQQLRDSEKLMRLVLNASRIGIWTHDFIADRTVWSPENCRIFGVAEFDGKGETFWKMVDPADRERVYRDFHRAIDTNCFYETEFPIIRPDGKKFWLRGLGECEYGADGNPLRFLGTIQDITERKFAEQSAVENLERFQNLVGISPFGIFLNRVVDGHHRITYANAECLRIFRAGSPEQVIGKSNFDFLHPDYHEIVRQRIAVMKSALKPVAPMEEKIIALDGSIVDVEITAAPIVEDGELTVLVTMQDITERKRRETNLNFFNEVTDIFARFSTPDEIMQAIGSRLGALLEVSHCQFMEVSEERDEVILLARWNEPGTRQMPQKVRLSDHINEESRKLALAGETVTCSDTKNNLISRGAANAALGVRSFITVPFIQSGTWKYQLSVTDIMPRVWRADEIELVRELANRVFPRLERARAQEALRASEEKFRLFVEHAPAAVAMFDREMRFLAVSNSFVKDYELSREQIIGRSQYEVFPHISDEWKAVHRRCLAGAVEKSDGERYMRPDGSVQWIKWEARPWYDDRGEIGGIVIFGEDITAQVEIADKIRQSEEKFRQLSNSLPQLVWTCLPDGRCDFLSRQWVEFTGIPEAEQLDYGWLEQLHPDDREPTARAWRKTVDEEGVFQVEYRIRRRDGIYRLFDTRALRLTDENGKTIKWVGSNTDITERKKAEEQLRLYEKIILTTRDALLITEAEPIDPPGPRIVYANPAFTEMTGYSLDDVTGKTPRILQGAKTERAKLKRIKKALKKWEPIRMNLTNYHKDGSEFIVDLDIFPIADETGFYTFWISLQRDVTEQKRLEKTIRDSAAKYRVLFELNPYPVFVLDVRTDEILAVNRAAVRLYGYSRQEFLKMTARQIRPPEDIPIYLDVIKNLKDKKEAHLIQVRHRKKNGEIIYVELSSYAMNYAGRKARYVILQDISERRRLASEAQREQREKLEVLESITESFVSLDRHLRYLYVNPAAENFLKKPASELIGRTILEVFPEAVKTTAFEQYRHILELGHPEEFELYDEPFQCWLRVRAYPTPSGLSVFWQDITERKKAEQLIQEKNQLLEQTYDAIFIWRIDDGIIYWNQNAEKLFGFSAPEAIGREAHELLETVYPVSRESFINRLRNEGFWEGELIHTTKAGEEVIVEGRMHVFQREDEKLIVLETLHDITERRRIEAKMARAAQLSLVGELAAGLAHEIKNPLAGIKGVIDILLQRREESKIPESGEREILENVGFEIERIDKTVRSLLQYSRPKPLELKLAPLDETVRRAVQFAFHRSGFRNSSRGEITTELELPDSPLLIPHDSTKIEDAVLNLILNAEDAIGDKEGGKIKVRLARIELDEDGQCDALIEVADNGCGIAPENLARIFTPFRTTKKDGTGLGLSTLKRIVRAHGGDCTVRSTPGEGSVFTIRLPFNNRDAAILQDWNQEKHR